jgi:hypothetical protein
MPRTPLLGILVIATIVSSSAAAPVTDAPRPHIVMLLADNVGWANVGFHKPPDLPAREIHTPNLDSLAKGGLILDRHYTYKFCSPSRSSFLSGRLPFHVNIYNDDPTTFPGAGVPVDMTMISDKLKTVGYHSHFIGKVSRAELTRWMKQDRNLVLISTSSTLALFPTQTQVARRNGQSEQANAPSPGVRDHPELFRQWQQLLRLHH